MIRPFLAVLHGSGQSYTYHVDFGTAPFVTVRAALFVAVPGVFHVQCAVFGSGRIAVSLDRVKSGITKEGVRVELRVE